MQVGQILNVFRCWAQLTSGGLREVVVVASSENEARSAAFMAYPNAIFMSCRPANAGTEAEIQVRNLAAAGRREVDHG